MFDIQFLEENRIKKINLFISNLAYFIFRKTRLFLVWQITSRILRPVQIPLLGMIIPLLGI